MEMVVEGEVGMSSRLSFPPQRLIPLNLRQCGCPLSSPRLDSCPWIQAHDSCPSPEGDTPKSYP